VSATVVPARPLRRDRAMGGRGARGPGTRWRACPWFRRAAV